MSRSLIDSMRWRTASALIVLISPLISALSGPSTTASAPLRLARSKAPASSFGSRTGSMTRVIARDC
jgi:hypothetical protein